MYYICKEKKYSIKKQTSKQSKKILGKEVIWDGLTLSDRNRIYKKTIKIQQLQFPGTDLRHEYTKQLEVQ